jgi:hypothetical protein
VIVPVVKFQNRVRLAASALLMIAMLATRQAAAGASKSRKHEIKRPASPLASANDLK